MSTLGLTVMVLPPSVLVYIVGLVCPIALVWVLASLASGTILNASVLMMPSCPLLDFRLRV